MQTLLGSKRSIKQIDQEYLLHGKRTFLAKRKIKI